MRYLKADWGLFIAALGLSLIGVVLIWSSTRGQVGSALAVRQLMAVGVGVALALLMVRLDARRLRTLAPWVYLAGLGGLLLVLGPLGATVNGSRSWIHLPGGFSLQPAELAKLSLCVGLAMILAEGRHPSRLPRAREVVTAWVVAGVPILLILGQPDLGTALVLGAMTIGMVAVSGARLAWTVTACAATVAAVVAAIRIPLLDQYQVDRLIAFRDPSVDPEGIGFQTQQVRDAISGGGWNGTGLGSGPQTQGGVIPYQHTDFVFSVAGEELGFWGSTALILLLTFLVLRALVVAMRCEDTFARLVAVGVAVWFAFQTFQTVGMSIGLMPVTGLPLPLLSYGGTSMVSCWVAIGLLFCVQNTDHDQRHGGPLPAALASR